jgi:hypothetical protein
MKAPNNAAVIQAGLAILLCHLITSCNPAGHEDNSHFFARLIPSIGDLSFSEKIDSFLVRQKKAVQVPNSGFSKNTSL